MNTFNKRLYDENNDGGQGAGGGGQAAPAASASAASASVAPVSSGDSLLSGSTPSADSSPSASVTAPNGAPPAALGTQAAGGDQWFVGLYDSTGAINTAKFDALPTHLKAHKETFAKYKTVEALLGGMSNLAQLAGKKGLAPLPPDAPAEVKAERAKLMAELNNAPKTPEGYGFKRPDSILESQWSEPYVQGIAGILHKHSASPELAKELMAFDAQHAGNMMEGIKGAETAAYAKEATALKDAFGGEYAKKIDLAVRGAKTLGMDINDPLFRNHKAVVMMSKFAEMVSEDRLVSGESSANAGMDDRAKALDIVNNAANPLHKAYHNPEDPMHAQAVSAKSQFSKAYLAKRPKSA